MSQISSLIPYIFYQNADKLPLKAYEYEAIAITVKSQYNL